MPIESSVSQYKPYQTSSKNLGAIVMSQAELSQEERILRMVKKVLTDIIKDTTTPPGMKHPLSDNTIHGIRDCLGLISARENELQIDAGRESQSRPHFIDEPQKNVVVNLKSPSKKTSPKDKKD
jgi:hypothetical protein